MRTQPVAVKSADYTRMVARVKFQPPSSAPHYRGPARHETKLASVGWVSLMGSGGSASSA